MYLKNIYLEFSRLSEYFKSLSLLMARILVAYGFYEPAMMKWQDMKSVAEWFGSMGIPFPTLNAYSTYYHYDSSHCDCTFGQWIFSSR